jgi:preprotein translocase subunit YajC
MKTLYGLKVGDKVRHNDAPIFGKVTKIKPPYVYIDFNRGGRIWIYASQSEIDAFISKLSKLEQALI